MLESSKYNIIWKNSSTPNLITHNDCEYASFLKDLERVCCKTGYLDSKFYTKNVDLKPQINEVKKTEAPFATHSYDIAKNRENFLDDYEKKMKKISISLLQEKRQERVLKRHEGDIIKRQHTMSQSLRDFESDVNDKKFQQDRKLNETAENLEKIRKRHYYEKSLMTKQRMRVAVNGHVEKRGKSRRIDLNVSKLLREFNAKKTELNSNTNAISSLMEDFEAHLSREENKHMKLQRELESITAALNMEIMKSKTQKIEMDRENIKYGDDKKCEDRHKERSLEQFLDQSDGGIKESEMERKLLDARLAMKNEEHVVRKKENSGALNTIRNKLAESENTQRQLIADTEYINLAMRRVDLQNKIESANLRKSSKQETVMDEMIKERELEEESYEDRMFKRQINLELENQSDNLKHLKVLMKNEKENEQKIYKKMNDASKEIKQVSTITNRLSNELRDLQVANAARINEDMREANKEEQHMQDELSRHRTKLIEMQSKRNNYFNELLASRKFLQEHNHRLQKSEVHTSRLATISERGH